MKPLRLAPLLLLVLSVKSCVAVAPAHASTIMPNLFAHKFCELRKSGLSHATAVTLAIRESTIPTKEWVYIQSDGRQVQSDIYSAVNEAVRRCRTLAIPE